MRRWSAQPHFAREAALALGFPRWRATSQVVVRAAWPGIVTGGLVAVARIAGETAPLLFTALGNMNFHTNVMQPMQTLSPRLRVRHRPVRRVTAGGSRPGADGHRAGVRARRPFVTRTRFRDG
jgi:ABC-type phosphate transport system permease subunit